MLWLFTQKEYPTTSVSRYNKRLRSISSTAYGFQTAVFQCLKFKASRMELSEKRGIIYSTIAMFSSKIRWQSVRVVTGYLLIAILIGILDNKIDLILILTDLYLILTRDGNIDNVQLQLLLLQRSHQNCWNSYIFLYISI